MTPFDAAAVLIVLAAALGYFNHRVLRLPSSIGLTVMGAVASLLVIGLEAVAIPWDPRLLALGLASVPLVLAARAIAVVAPLVALRPVLSLGRPAPVTLIWEGLRGGISVALALGLPDGPARSVTLAATYVVVIFSVIVQGGTVERVLVCARRRAGE